MKGSEQYQYQFLGPLLFIIYINDIVGVTDGSFCNMYADDTVIVSSNIDAKEATLKSMYLFDKISEWCILNKIKVNRQKTKDMMLGRDKKLATLDDMTQNNEISSVKNFTYLGVNLDDRLNFEKFVNGTIGRVNARLITFARIRKNVDVKTALLMYKQTILPILDYLCIVVNSSTQVKIKKLQPLQNRAVRIIEKLVSHISTQHMNDLHVRLKLELLKDRRKRFMLKLMYKLSRDEENVDRYRPERVLRTAPKVKMKMEFTDQERVLRSPYYACNRLWEKLDSDTQASSNIFEFTNRLCMLDISEL